MANIVHRIGVSATAADVYHFLTTDAGLSRWWTNDTSGAGNVGSIIQFRFNGMGPDFEIIELQVNSLVRWKHSSDMPEPWMGTEISFQLKQEKNQTYIFFSHSNWQQQTEFMGHCSTKWGTFLLSLKDAIETGKGRPFPDDIHIDHDE